MSGKDVLRIGFIGAGLISNLHALLLQQSSLQPQIVAVHDVVEKRRDRFASAYGATAVDSAEAVIDAADVVYVTTWTSEHAHLVAAAAAAGKAVCCEKPLAFSGAEARTIVDSAASVPSHVGLILRYAPQLVWARHLLQQPEAGRLMAVSFRDDQYIPVQGRYASTWRGDPARAGHGTLLEHSIHDLDVIQWLCGPITSVSGSVRSFHDLGPIEDLAAARLELAGGGVANLVSIWHDVLERPSLRLLELFAERLHIRFEGDFDAVLSWQQTGEPACSDGPVELVERCIAAGVAPSPDVATLLGFPIFNPTTAFLAAVRDGTDPPLPLSAALPAHDLVDAVYRSAAEGGAVVTLG